MTYGLNENNQSFFMKEIENMTITVYCNFVLLSWCLLGEKPNLVQYLMTEYCVLRNRNRYYSNENLLLMISHGSLFDQKSVN